VGTPVLLLLIWLFGASACLLLYLGSKLTFLLDDWEFLLYRRDFSADAILDPHGEHIVALPVLIYKALLATVGMGSALPYRVVSVGLFLLSAALLFAYLRRRVGDWPALAATAVVLFLGSAWEDLLWSFQMTYFGSVAAGLGALLALEREDRRGEVAACALLVVSILFSSLGLSFAIGAAVFVLLGDERRRRLYLFLVPLAVYALWWLGWGHTAESALSFHNVARTPLYVLDGLATSVGSATGLANNSVTVHDRLIWSRPLAIALVFLAAWRLYRLPRVPRWFWVTLAIGGSFWVLAGFNQMPGREADASRYQYLGVVFALMIAAEVLRPELKRGLRIGRGAGGDRRRRRLLGRQQPAGPLLCLQAHLPPDQPPRESRPRRARHRRRHGRPELRPQRRRGRHRLRQRRRRLLLRRPGRVGLAGLLGSRNRRQPRVRPLRRRQGRLRRPRDRTGNDSRLRSALGGLRDRAERRRSLAGPHPAARDDDDRGGRRPDRTLRAEAFLDRRGSDPDRRHRRRRSGAADDPA
jgi:hypothetical protein